jgi:hypothetical protein
MSYDLESREYFVEIRWVIVDLTLLVLLFLVDEIGGGCGAPSMGMCTSGKENERVESMFNNELTNDNKGTRKGVQTALAESNRRID